MSIKYYAHFLVDEPGPRGLQEYRGIVELDGTPRRDRELKEAVMIIARNFGRAAEVARAADPRRRGNGSLGRKATRLVFERFTARTATS